MHDIYETCRVGLKLNLEQLSFMTFVSHFNDSFWNNGDFPKKKVFQELEVKMPDRLTLRAFI